MFHCLHCLHLPSPPFIIERPHRRSNPTTRGLLRYLSRHGSNQSFNHFTTVDGIATRNAWILGSWHQGSSRFITIRLLDTRRSPSSQSCWEYLAPRKTSEWQAGKPNPEWICISYLMMVIFQLVILVFKRGVYDLSYYKFRHLDFWEGTPNQFISIRAYIYIYIYIFFYKGHTTLIKTIPSDESEFYGKTVCGTETHHGFPGSPLGILGVENHFNVCCQKHWF